MYREIIQDSIDYIEENIKCDISAAELSEKPDFHCSTIIDCFRLQLECL